MNKIKIEMYSDYACPFCYIGKRYLEQALEQFAGRNEVEIVHKAYELYPTMSEEVTSTTQGRIEWKYHKTPEAAMEMIRGIEQKAAGAGLAMNYEKVQNTNTFTAHRLTKFAESKGKGAEMNERLFKAYFTDNLPLANRATLLQCAEDVGLNLAEVTAFLNSDVLSESVRADEQQAKHIGVQAVPFFVINDEIAVAGSQPPAQFLALLESIKG
ncbi:DsbA family oxidoreductase [Actinobacillus vicugnae]|uniref:DsbA family oxidoreductase n=1 Tax=Actinobacillus vicugnae TaxID=2573093 RepID=UPI001FCB1504|nr:DsbA family oxidoreductase [Actinobacillus vicugnae]